MLYQQREVRDVPVVCRKGSYPATPEWWMLVEVAHRMAASVPKTMAFQRIQRMGEALRESLSPDAGFPMGFKGRGSLSWEHLSQRPPLASAPGDTVGIRVPHSRALVHDGLFGPASS